LFWCPASEVRGLSQHALTRTSEAKGHQQAYDSSAAFDLKSLNEAAASGAATSNRRHWLERPVGIPSHSKFQAFCLGLAATVCYRDCIASRLDRPDIIGDPDFILIGNWPRFARAPTEPN
jgi:hypothetical protein